MICSLHPAAEAALLSGPHQGKFGGVLVLFAGILLVMVFSWIADGQIDLVGRFNFHYALSAKGPLFWICSVLFLALSAILLGIGLYILILA